MHKRHFRRLTTFRKERKTMTKHVMDSVGNKKPVEPERNDWGYPNAYQTKSIGEIVNELTLNGESLEDKLDELTEQVNDLETKLDEADVAEKVEALENRLDDIDYKLDETSEQIKEMATNASAIVEIIKQVATR